MKKYGTDPKDAKGVGAFGSSSNTNKNKTDSKYASSQGGKDKYSDNKYSSKTKGVGSQDKYSTETKYSVNKGGASETTKYTSQSKYSTGSSGLERRASYKSVERWDNEKNAAREKDRALAAKDNKYSTKDASKDDKYKTSSTTSSWGGSKDRDDPKAKQYSFFSSAATKDKAWAKDQNDAKSKYSLSTKTETKGDYKSSTSSSWCSKAFSSADPRYDQQRAFSSQTASSTWEDRNRGRAFPYDRDHELRRSLNRYDADAKNLDPKYRKTALTANGGTGLAAGLGLGASSATGASGVGSAGHAAVGTRLRDDRGTAAATTGCHNCTLQ